MTKNIVKVWTFASESTPGKTYETIKYSDGSTSCNCRAWVFKTKKVGNLRTCSHTRKVDMGIADRAAESFIDYTTTKVSVEVTVQTQNTTTRSRNAKRVVVATSGRRMTFED